MNSAWVGAKVLKQWVLIQDVDCTSYLICCQFSWSCLSLASWVDLNAYVDLVLKRSQQQVKQCFISIPHNPSLIVKTAMFVWVLVKGFNGSYHNKDSILP